MPIYLFKNPQTGDVKAVVQKMTDEHCYEENGVIFERIFTIPQSIIDGKIDPFSARDFVEKTKNKRGTVGDLWDASRECTVKRGEDHPVNRKAIEDYSKKRAGRKPLQEQHQQLKKELASKGFDLEI